MAGEGIHAKGRERERQGRGEGEKLCSRSENVGAERVPEGEMSPSERLRRGTPDHWGERETLESP